MDVEGVAGSPRALIVPYCRMDEDEDACDCMADKCTCR